MNREALLRAVEILAAEPDADSRVLRLQSAGFSGSDSRVLADVIPEAFAIPVVEELGVTAISDMASARTRYGRWAQVRLGRNPIFVAALSLAREHHLSGALDHRAYRTIAEGSALLGAVNKALNAGVAVKGGSMRIALLGAKAEDLGYKPWFLRFWTREAG